MDEISITTSRSGCVVSWRSKWCSRQYKITIQAYGTSVRMIRHYYAPPLIGGGIKRWFCLTSDVCLSDVLSVTYIGPKSITERPIHYSLFTICGDACPPFIHQCWGLHRRLAQCTRPQGWGKLINAVLLSLINEACECMLRYPPLEWTRRPRLCAGMIE